MITALAINILLAMTVEPELITKKRILRHRMPTGAAAIEGIIGLDQPAR